MRRIESVWLRWSSAAPISTSCRKDGPSDAALRTFFKSRGKPAPTLNKSMEDVWGLICNCPFPVICLLKIRFRGILPSSLTFCRLFCWSGYCAELQRGASSYRSLAVILGVTTCMPQSRKVEGRCAVEGKFTSASHIPYTLPTKNLIVSFSLVLLFSIFDLSHSKKR